MGIANSWAKQAAVAASRLATAVTSTTSEGATPATKERAILAVPRMPIRSRVGVGSGMGRSIGRLLGLPTVRQAGTAVGLYYNRSTIGLLRPEKFYIIRAHFRFGLYGPEHRPERYVWRVK